MEPEFLLLNLFPVRQSMGLQRVGHVSDCTHTHILLPTKNFDYFFSKPVNCYRAISEIRKLLNMEPEFSTKIFVLLIFPEDQLTAIADHTSPIVEEVGLSL